MVFQSAIENFSDTNRRRVDLSCGISYGDNLDKVKEIAIKSIEGSDFLAENEKVDLVFTEFGDSSINFDLRFWLKDTKQGTYNDAKSDAIIKLKKAFDDNNIMIPFPIRTLDFGIRGGEKLDTMLKSRMD
jgi:small conductance mechanosensitive channel